MDSSPSPLFSVKLSHSAVFPTPTAVPQQVAALPTEMNSVGLAIMRQIKQERDVYTGEEGADRICGVCSHEQHHPGDGESCQSQDEGEQRHGGGLLERDMVIKLGGLENRLANELASSQSREAICCAVVEGVTIDRWLMAVIGRNLVGRLLGLRELWGCCCSRSVSNSWQRV